VLSSRSRKTTRRDFPQIAESELSGRRLDAVCPGPVSRIAVQRPCQSQDQLASLRLLAACTVVATCFVLLAIHWAGRRCRRNHTLLLSWFRIGCRLMMAATQPIVISQAILFAGTLYHGAAVFLGRIFSGLMS